jgi:hypothetical protein
MVSAGTGIPETILSGNAEAGNLATAKTLDRPTELLMSTRQTVWQDALVDIIEYDLKRGHADGSVPAFEPDPQGAAPETDPATGITVAGAQVEVDLTAHVDFPDVLEDDVTVRVAAIIQAATLGKAGTSAGTMPDQLLSRLLLSALGVDDIDEILDDLFPPDPPAGIYAPEPPADAGIGAADVPLADPLLALPAEAQFREALDAFAARLADPVRRTRSNGAGRRVRRAVAPPATTVS